MSGRCLCASVKFRIRVPLRPTAAACHCSTCRRFTGGLWIGTLTSYQSSPGARRGFCGRCGSSLFWEGDDEPTGHKLAVHSWTAESADYWSFDPGIPRKPGPSGLGWP